MASIETITDPRRDDALVRLGLALYRETKKSGNQYFSLHDLIFDHIRQSVSAGFFERIFHGGRGDFWSKEEELAKALAQTGIAEHFSRPMPGERFLREHSVKLTSYGRALYDLAHADSERSRSTVEGMSIDELSIILRNADASAQLADDIERLEPQLEALDLSNFQRATVNSYVKILTVVSRMPDPDVRLFWTVLERLNQFAGVGSLIVALIALKLAK